VISAARAGSPGTHRGQRRPHERGRAEQVQIHQLAQLRVADLLDRSDHSPARVVDENVELTEAVEGGPHERRRRGDVSGVEVRDQNVVGVFGARSATLSGRRTAATTWSPAASADSATARPKPRDAPVMIQVWVVMAATLWL
jgi:hypothetical protein